MYRRMVLMAVQAPADPEEEEEAAAVVGFAAQRVPEEVAAVEEVAVAVAPVAAEAVAQAEAAPSASLCSTLPVSSR